MWNKSELKPGGITCHDPKTEERQKIFRGICHCERGVNPASGSKSQPTHGTPRNAPRKFCAGSRCQTAALQSRQVEDRWPTHQGVSRCLWRRPRNPPRSSAIRCQSRNITKYITFETSSLSAEAETQELEKLTKLGVIAPMDAPRMNLKTQVHRILLPRTPCHQRGPETRPRQDKGCARNAATGQHQSSQKILWIHQSLSKVYAETKWSHGVY